MTKVVVGVATTLFIDKYYQLIENNLRDQYPLRRRENLSGDR